MTSLVSHVSHQRYILSEIIQKEVEQNLPLYVLSIRATILFLNSLPENADGFAL